MIPGGRMPPSTADETSSCYEFSTCSSVINQEFLPPFLELIQITLPKPFDLSECFAGFDGVEGRRVLQQVLHFIEREILWIKPLQRQRQRDAHIHRIQRIAVRDHEANAATRFVFEHAGCRREAN